MSISIRPSIEADLEAFFNIQADDEAIQMAAFTAEDPYDKTAYLEKWRKLIQKDSIHMQTIILEKKVVGCVVKFIMEGDAELTYSLAKEYWGKGLTTLALGLFLKEEKTRPIFGRVAYDNFGSQKVLQKNGFESIGTDIGYANARGKDITEYVYRLQD